MPKSYIDPLEYTLYWIGRTKEAKNTDERMLIMEKWIKGKDEGRRVKLKTLQKHIVRRRGFLSNKHQALRLKIESIENALLFLENEGKEVEKTVDEKIKKGEDYISPV